MIIRIGGALTSMMYFTVTIFVVLCPLVHSSTHETFAIVESGLESGKGIAEMLENGNFRHSLTVIGKKVGPYLGAVGPFIGFLMATIPSTSSELDYMKKMMKFVDLRFNKIDKRLDDIAQKITWIKYENIRSKIRIMEHLFDQLINAPPDAVVDRRKDYIDTYISTYQKSGLKLYHHIIPTTPDDLGSSVLLYTKSDRKKTQLYLLGFMTLLLQAVKIELSYLYLTSNNSNIDYETEQWTNQIEIVRKRFYQIDGQCVNAYYSKSGHDIEVYSAQNKGISNFQFAKGLYELLCLKYYWRDWIVVVYDPISGYEHHTVWVHGGHIKFRKDGRNILVASVDKHHPVMNLARAQHQMLTVPMTYRYRSGKWFSRYRNKRYRARTIFNKLDITGASLGSVIRCYAHITYYTEWKRLRVVNRCPKHYMLIMWG